MFMFQLRNIEVYLDGFRLISKVRATGDGVKLTSVQSLLEVNRGLMVVPKPTMLRMVPEGRLFSATTMASCGNKRE